MQEVRSLEYCTGSREELLPGMTADFPYIATRAELDYYVIPWHWHKEVEIFYIESGALEYYTQKGSQIFSAGSGGFVNSNVLHMTKPLSEREKNIQLLHIFDTSFLSGEQGSRIEQKYVAPIAASPRIEMAAFSPHDPEQAEILRLIQKAFLFSEKEFGYELRLREILTHIWLLIYNMLGPKLAHEVEYGRDIKDESLKLMMIFVREHFAEKISISDLASAAFLSERECYRIFQRSLHVTPVEYIKSVRLREACRLLGKTQRSITSISYACGFGSSSYFGKTFRETMGCTPLEYRQGWQGTGGILPQTIKGRP